MSSDLPPAGEGKTGSSRRFGISQTDFITMSPEERRDLVAGLYELACDEEGITPPAPAYRAVRGPANSRTVPLTYPIENGRSEISAIVVRRMTVAEVRDWTDGVAANRRAHLPMFELPDGRPVPAGALDALDHDDWAELDKAATDFLPRALRGFLASDPASESGVASQP